MSRPIISLARALAIACSLVAGANAADLIPVRVTAALDGDTVVVQGMDQRVRLASIDAPETSHGRSRPGQPWSAASQKWLEQAVVDRRGLTMRCLDEDRYRRPVCELWLDGRSINVEIVRAGLAWANTANKRYIRDPAVHKAHDEARRAGRGLWASSHAIAPWEWRHTCWGSSSQDIQSSMRRLMGLSCVDSH